MSDMFGLSQKLNNIIYDPSTFVTTNVKDMSDMFAYCPFVNGPDTISFVDTSNAVNMSGMFRGTFSKYESEDIDLSFIRFGCRRQDCSEGYFL